MITLSLKGRFPTLYLAKHLATAKIPFRLLTSYPGFFTSTQGIPTTATSSIHEVFFVEKMIQKLSLSRFVHINWHLSEWFDLRAAKLIRRDTTLFNGWSQISLRCLKTAHKYGAKGILERGSTHICMQDDLLRQEYELHGLQYRQIDSRIIDKELAEYAEADYISIPSRFARSSFIARGVSEKKLIMVPYGVDPDLFRPKRKLDNVFRIIQCSHLSLRKGVHYLLQAFNELNLPSAELWLIGSITGEIEPFIRRYRNPRVFLKGAISFNRLHEYYSQGSLFCLPSIEEGMAMVQAQAMACGLPVICTTNTGGADILRNGQEGFIIPIRDVESLKEKILYLYENREVCSQMGYSALERVRSGFTWADYANKILDEYRLRGLLNA